MTTTSHLTSDVLNVMKQYSLANVDATKVAVLIEEAGISERALEEMFDGMLDETFDDCEIIGLSYTPSHVLKNVDEVAYREEFANWLDGEGYIETHDYHGFVRYYIHADALHEILGSLEDS